MLGRSVQYSCQRGVVQLALEDPKLVVRIARKAMGMTALRCARRTLL